MLRRWIRRFVAALCLLVTALASVPAARVIPLFRDDMMLDRVVVAVALDWRDFGVEIARRRLQYELDHHRIGQHVGDEDCALDLEGDRVRRVHCRWEVRVHIPAMEEPYPLTFVSTARVDRNGVLLR
jgi:hypothetical protein